MAFEFRWILFISLVAASLAFILVGVAAGPGLGILKFIMGLLAILCDILAMASRYYTYLFDPLRKMKGKKLVLDSGDPYIMSPSGTAIMKRVGDLVYATVFVKIPIYKSGTEMEDQEKIDFATSFGKMLSIIKEPFRISTQLYVLNKDEYIEKIRAKLNETQDKYNQIMNKEGGGTTKKEVAPEVEHLRGKVTMWRNMLESVSRAKSHSMMAYAMVSAIGSSEEEAVNLAISKGDELAAGISSTYGISASLATGKEILQFIEPEQMIPIANLSSQISVRSGLKQV